MRCVSAVVIVLLSTLFVPTAGAEFTAAEKAELGKLVEAYGQHIARQAFRQTARSFELFGNLQNQALHADAMSSIALANEALHTSMAQFANSPKRRLGNTRTETVERAFKSMDTGIDNVKNARQFLVAIH